jgi:TolB-like protein/DNA-binding winged helix-turn-helix (wHTH) protein
MEADKQQAPGAGAVQAPTGGRYLLGDWMIDEEANRIFKDESEVRIEPKVMRVLILLVSRQGQVVSRHELESQVWPGMIVTDDAVTSASIKLRKALGDNARSPRYIETIAKSGYRLIAEVIPPKGDSALPLQVAQSDQSNRPLSGGVETGDVAGSTVSWKPWLVASVGLMAALAFWLVAQTVNDRSLPSAERSTQPLIVAVLPFDNLTADAEQDYFAVGVTEDLITDLSKLSGLQVVARNSVMAYRNTVLPDSQIGRELGARYLVKGSVQRSGGRLRINVYLSDAQEGHNRWAERYDRDLADIFEVQDEIATRVVSALQIELQPGEQQRLTRKYATSVEAYDQYLLGRDLLGRRASSDNREARSYFERAIELEPRFARAHAGLAMTYALHAVYGRGPEVIQSLIKAEEVARRGLEIDDSVPQLRFAIAMVEMFKGNLAAAIAEISRAIELEPSYADGYGLLARILHFAGRPEEGLEAIDRAIGLNPRVPALYLMVKGALLHQLGRNEDALRQLQASVEMSPHLMLTRVSLASVYAEIGQLDAAQWQVEEIRSLDPDFAFEDLDYGFPIRDPEFRERFFLGLQRAGLNPR